MSKPRFLLLSLVLTVAGISSATALYPSAPIGPTTGTPFFEPTRYFHDNSWAPMAGMSGREDNFGYLAWMAGRADGGHWTPAHGFQLEYDGDYHDFCRDGDFVSGFKGWSSTGGGVHGLRLRCRSKGSTISYDRSWVLGRNTGTYKAIQCGNTDVAYGFWGYEGSPFLMSVGLICHDRL